MKAWKAIGVAAVLIATLTPVTVDGESQEWIQLFNGSDLTGWTPKITGYELGNNFGDTFHVENGVLKVTVPRLAESRGRKLLIE